MKRDDSIYLQHILDAINRIEEYLDDVDEITFLERHLVQDGVIRQLEIVGEAVKQLSSELRIDNDGIPWQDVAGMRDKLIHHYFGVDLRSVFQTVKEDIPALKNEVQSILNKKK